MAAEAIWPALRRRPAAGRRASPAWSRCSTTSRRPARRPIALLDCLVAATPRRGAGAARGPARSAPTSTACPSSAATPRSTPATAPALSTFAVGRARGAPCGRATPGRATPCAWLVCLEGEMVPGPEGRVLQPPARAAARPRRAPTSRCWPRPRRRARPGPPATSRCPASRARCCSSWRAPDGLGCALDVDALPVPAGRRAGGWILAFPSYALPAGGRPRAPSPRASARRAHLRAGRDPGRQRPAAAAGRRRRGTASGTSRPSP